MLDTLKKISAVLFIGLACQRADAFSLIGPLDTWQAQDIGYDLPPGDLGGVMNLGEEYRFNTPILLYGFDQTFLDFFGSKGIEAVESAIAILNNLPAMSELSPDLSEFPLDTRRFNYAAGALGLRDLKSFALSYLLQQLGLAAPERYIFTLRSRVLVNNIPFYHVIKRNFDPITLNPSSYVNGTLYTYFIAQTYANPDVWEPVEEAVDPLAPTLTAVASYLDRFVGTYDFRGAITLTSPGLFYTGLTRDDVGGLRYIYRKNNYNMENIATNAVAGALASSGSQSGGSPWSPVGGGGTGNTGGGGVGGGVGGGQTTVTNTVVDLALRPGVDKIRFVRVNFDGLFGTFLTNNVVYSDLYITNSTLFSQVVTRAAVIPDIIFSAGDQGVAANNGTPVLFSATIGWVNNSAINGGPGQPGTTGGPGTVNGPLYLGLSSVGPYFRNVGGGSELTAARSFVWGFFDGSTNAPIVFPSGFSIREIEQSASEVLGGASPWRLP